LLEIEPDRLRIIAPRRASFRFLIGPAFALVIAWFSPKLHAFLYAGEPGSGVAWFFFSLVIAKGVWDATSRDIIVVEEKGLSLNRGILGLGWTRRYPLCEIGRLRWVPPVQAGKNAIPSCIAFDSQYMPVGCAWEIGEPQANEIIDLIKSRFPQIGTETKVSVF